MRSSLLVFLLLFRRVVSRINNGSTLFHAKVIKDQILIIPFDWRIQLCTICHASGFHYFKYGSRTDIIYKGKQKIDRSKEILSIPLITYRAYSVFVLETFARQNYNIYIFSSNFSSFSIFLSKFFLLVSLISEKIRIVKNTLPILSITICLPIKGKLNMLINVAILSMQNNRQGSSLLLTSKRYVSIP